MTLEGKTAFVAGASRGIGATVAMALPRAGAAVSVNCLSPSRVVLTEGWQAGGAGMGIPEEMVEPPEAMANAVRLAQQDAGGVTGTIQRSESLTF